MMGAAGLTVPPEVARSAVEWWLQQQEGALNEGQRQAWQAWRDADPLHEQAWQHLARVNDKLNALAAPGGRGSAEVARAALAPRGSARRRRVVQTLAVLVFGGAVAWQAEQQLPWRRWTADVQTARGERKRMRLDDGTQLVLNGATALNIDYSAGLRRLRLVEGEVLITTAPDSQQPARDFVVQTREGLAQALGTRFSVRSLAGRGSLVAVFEGAVRLSPAHNGGGGQLLQAGFSAVLQAQSVSAPQAAYEDSLAWTDGMLVARGMALADMLAALQPYSAERLVCDPAVAGLRMSGSYPLADVARVLATLDALPGLRVRRLVRWWGQREVVVEKAG
ncbi:FecR domain-containing protein [Comamonas sp. JUb58]|uniref:FecR domain-containing protein n=1 Tax=Comamonas sp. JUb58 TaxID=2485114 RepID=UPI0010D1C3A3|nr:FecR domain-containing protein [Comamonas sp. JUb58]TDS85015.1 FecR family protein [Comamonas sp. JUb58]